MLSGKNKKALESIVKNSNYDSRTAIKKQFGNDARKPNSFNFDGSKSLVHENDACATKYKQNLNTFSGERPGNSGTGLAKGPSFVIQSRKNSEHKVEAPVSIEQSSQTQNIFLRKKVQDPVALDPETQGLVRSSVGLLGKSIADPTSKAFFVDRNFGAVNKEAKIDA